MKRPLLLCCLFSLLTILPVSAQVKSAASKSLLRGLVSEKWLVQHYHVSVDGRTMVLSALVPGSSQYDLYLLTCSRGVWSKPQLLSSSVNSVSNEYWPCLSPDEQILYFVRETPSSNKKDEPQYTLMMSSRLQEGWDDAQALIISENCDVSPYMLPDGRTMLFARGTHVDKRSVQYGLYRMEKLDKVNWTEPTLLLAPEERNMHYYGFSVSDSHIRYTIEMIDHKDTTIFLGDYDLPDSLRWQPVLTIEGQTLDDKGRLLAVTMDVRNGVTGDLMASYRTDGRYKLVLPSGKKYTIDCYSDGTNHFYLEPDCRTLQKDTTWVRDFRFETLLYVDMHVYDALDNTALRHSTHRLPIGREYSFPVSYPAYRDTVITIDTRNPVLMTHSELDIALMPTIVPLRVCAVDAETDSLLQVFSVDARQGKNYPFHLEAVGYTYADTTVFVPYHTDTMFVKIPLRTLRADMIMQLHSIQFEYNSADLKEESYEELQKVVRLLQMNTELRIELSAHTDDKGTDTYNDRLSLRRGDVVKQFIVSQGIDAGRVEARGYGKRRPLVPNDTEEHRAQNRRVEFKILGL